MQISVYARYSSDKQKDTSIEDQVRKCRSLLDSKGLSGATARLYSDHAVTGGQAGLGKRLAFAKLVDAIEAGVVAVVAADEVSRLMRNVRDAATLHELVEQRGLHIMTCDGLDTAAEGWQTVWHIKVLMAMEETRRTAARTARTAIGALERGLMLGPAPFGYCISGYRLDTDKKPIPGALWEIDPEGAEVVRRMFAWRRAGHSAARIAGMLNEAGIHNPGRNRKGKTATNCYWRPGTVHRILGSRIYKGEYVHHGSATTRAIQARRKQPWSPKVYMRPQFRLVSDELWDACNPPRKQDRVRGGGKHVLAGILRCGVCFCTLCLKAAATSRSIHCPQCEQAVRVGEPRPFVGYTSESAAFAALEAAIRLTLSEAVMGEFRERLSRRLAGDSMTEADEIRQAIRDHEAVIARMLPLLENPRLPLAEIEATLERHGDACDAAKLRLKELDEGMSPALKSTMRRQLSVDPGDYIAALLRADGVAPHEVRAMLKRFLPEFTFVAKRARYHAVFRMQLIPGVAVGLKSETEAVDTEPVALEVEVVGSARRPVVWEVHVRRI